MHGSGFRALSWLLAAALLSATCLQAQQGGLKIVVLNGDGGINNIEGRVGVEPIVEVRGADGKPAPGAVVTFRSPPSGPSVTFFGAARTSTITADDAGRAQATGMLPNTESGAFYIDVEATHEGQTATARLTQTNMSAPGAPKTKSGLGWRWWAVIGAAAAIGITAVVLGGEGDSDPSGPTTGITFNGVTVGAPR